MPVCCHLVIYFLCTREHYCSLILSICNDQEALQAAAVVLISYYRYESVGDSGSCGLLMLTLPIEEEDRAHI
jgi:hypothetical protein